MMRNSLTLVLAMVAGAMLAGPVAADTARSQVAFNNGIGKKTDSQPAGGLEVAYQVAPKGGQLDGCTIDIVEQLFPRDEGAWGIFVINGDVTCANGTLAYESAGSWDGNGFHAAGKIKGGSGSFDGVKGRVAQLGGGAKPAGDGTADIAYELVLDAE